LTLSALLACAASTALRAAEGDTMYVSDELLITFRTQPSNRSEIIRNLTTGTSMEVLEMPEGSEWARVRLQGGREGWVRRQYLQNQPVAQDRLAAANRDVEQLTRTVADLRARLETVQEARSEAESSSESLDERVQTLTQELAEIRQVSASAIETAAENRRLTELNTRLRAELDELVEERDRLEADAEQRGLMIGGGLVLLGLILGVILKSRPQRSAWT
jgi:SH3 domain protein